MRFYGILYANLSQFQMTADGTIDIAYTKSKLPASVGDLLDTCSTKAGE